MAEALNLTLTLTPTLDAAKLNVLINQLKSSLGPLGKDIKPIDADKLNAELGKLSTGSAKAKRELEQVAQKMSQASAQGGGLANSLGKIGSKLLVLNQASQLLTAAAQGFQSVIAVGNEYESTLAAVGAITGQTGEGLDKLGAGARELAVQFGGSASDNLKSFQGILSKFGPQVAENAEALKSMGQTVNTLSAASGDSADVSMAALTDTMLQLGLVTGDSAKDAATMVKVADALAASAKVGAAEIPQVAQSILQTGVAAKGAKLSLEQTTAAIQVLAVGGKVGSEAGVALRNVLGFLQKQSGPGAEALQKMGLSVEQLGETLTTQGLDAALGLLKGGLDQAGTAAEKNAILMTLFGTENAAAAGILLDNASLLSDFQAGIGAAVEQGAQGADGALAQANARLGTADAIAARMKARIEDVFISIQGTIGSGASALLTATTQMAPAIASVAGLATIIPDGASANVVEFAKKLLVTLVPSLATSGTMAGTTGFSFTAMWTAVTGPVGLVVAGILAVGASLVLLYQNVEGFREVVDGAFDFMIDAFNTVQPIFERIMGLVTSLGGLVFDYVTLPFQISWGIVVAIADAIGFWGAKLADLLGFTSETGDRFEGVRAIVEKIVLAFDILTASVDGIRASIGAFVDATTGSLGKLLEGDFSGAISGFFGAGKEAANAYKEGFSDSLRDAQIERTIETLSEGLNAGITVQAKLDQAGSLDELSTALDNLQSRQAEIQLKVDAGTATEGEITQLENLKAKAQETAAQIAQVAPEAVNSVKNVVDAAGNVVQVYDVNTAKAREFQAAAQEALGGEAQKSADGYSAKLGKLGKLYESQKADLEEIRVAAEKAANAGDEKRAKELTDEYKKQKEAADATGQALEKAFTDGANAGLLTEEAFKRVAEAQGITVEEAKKQALAKALAEADATGAATEKQITKIAGNFKVSVEEARALLEAQRAQKKAAEETASKVKDIGEAFKENKKAADDQFSAEFDRAAALQNEIDQIKVKIRKKQATDEDRARIKEAQAELKAKLRELDEKKRLVDLNEGSIETIRKRYEKPKQKDRKSEFEELKKNYDVRKRTIELDREDTEIAREQQILAEGREKNSLDDLANEQLKLQSLQDQMKALRELNLIGEDGTINPEFKFKDGAEEQEAIALVRYLNQEIAKQQNRIRTVQVKVDTDAIALEEKLRQARLDGLRAAVEGGLAGSEELIAALGSEVEGLTDKIIAADAETRFELLEQRAKYEQEIEKLARGRVAAEIKAYEERKAVEDAEFAEQLDRTRRQAEALTNVSARSGDLRISVDRDSALKEIERLQADELIGKEEFEERKKAIEERYANERAANEQRIAGQRLFIEEGIAQQQLEAQRKALEEKIALAQQENEITRGLLQDRLKLAEALGDEEAQKRIQAALAVDASQSVANLQAELGKVNDELAEKGDTLTFVGEQLKAGLEGSINTLFEGDLSGAKEGMKNVLSLIAGYLEKLATAAVIEIVLGSAPLKALAGTFGLFAPIALAGFSQIVSLGIRSILNPILASITAFPTGAVFTKPTLAMVGDGARLGGSNTEYLLRNDQIRALINEVTASRDQAVVQAINLQTQALAAAFGSMRLRGQDIYLASSRAARARNRRSRGLT